MANRNGTVSYSTAHTYTRILELEKARISPARR